MVTAFSFNPSVVGGHAIIGDLLYPKPQAAGSRLFNEIKGSCVCFGSKDSTVLGTALFGAPALSGIF